jgi:hypothetical protein
VAVVQASETSGLLPLQPDEILTHETGPGAAAKALSPCKHMNITNNQQTLE